MQKAKLGMELSSSSVPPGIYSVRIIHKTHFSALYRHVKHDRDTRLDRVHWRCGGTTHCIIKKQQLTSLQKSYDLAHQSRLLWWRGSPSGYWHRVGFARGEVRPAARVQHAMVGGRQNRSRIIQTHVDVGSSLLVIRSGKTAFSKLLKEGKFPSVWSRGKSAKSVFTYSRYVSACIHWPARCVRMQGGTGL